MPSRGFFVYDPGLPLLGRLKALGPRIRAQGGMGEASEFTTKTEVIRELVEFAEDLLERGDYAKARHPTL